MKTLKNKNLIATEDTEVTERKLKAESNFFKL